MEKFTQKAVEMYKQEPIGFTRRLAEEIIRPNLGRINAALGQENDALYLAYLVEYVITRARVPE